MPSAILVDSHAVRMEVSPRSPLNCQVLGLHLPPPSSGQPSRTKASYYSSPMSSSSSYVYSSQHHQRPGSTQQYAANPARPSTGANSPTSSSHYSRSLTAHSSSEHPEDSLSRAMTDSGHSLDTGTDDTSSATHDSPGNSHLVMGSPGVARRAKAHVPSACVNCKRKHLACETRRPCNRCLQAGKEATCVDVQHKKRGRPRLRDEEAGRSGTYGNEYSHPHLYPAQSDMHALQGSDARVQPRTLSYREIRSHPDAMYGQRSAPSYPPLQAVRDMRNPVVPLQNLPETTPIALLSLDLIILRSNYTFSDALSLQPNTEGLSLRDLVIVSEREKLQRLQNSLRAELNDAAHLPPLHNPPLSHQPFDLLASTAGFHSRSEYWTFRLPNEQSRGFPISISLARTSTYFLVLTLVSSGKPAIVLPSTSSTKTTWIPSLPSPSLPPPLQSPISEHPFQTTLPYHTGPHHLHSVRPVNNDLTQYRQRSPQNENATSPVGGSSSSAGRGSLHEVEVSERLRHLQLPPIRTSGIEQGRRERTKGSSAKGSPQSAKRKKRRVVGIEEILR